ncbi:carboxylating nicotinate-nucleotide diphosphorylase [Pirellulales bacterium]|nr:carboxylating nicotinate-nucleotide diphosphorylase [Pirellulales bacterium]
MDPDFRQIIWDDATIAECRAIFALAIAEDGGRAGDVTSAALGAAGQSAMVQVAAREAGVAAGLPAIALLLDQIEASDVDVELLRADGDRFAAGTILAQLRGPADAVLFAERTMLNLLGRLCGIATLAQQYAERVAGTRTRVYDTRKTTPGWRRLEKYAVACGGCRNHRTSLADAFLIKDNHLRLLSGNDAADGNTARDAIEAARRYAASKGQTDLPVEIEVDTLEQLEGVLPGAPDIVLLDNMTPELLRRAVGIRNATAPGVELEASGGVTLANLRGIAETGVDRISVGGLTHAARSLDVGLDWQSR